MSEPRYSADGFYYWDGTRWIPREQLPAQPPAYQPVPLPQLSRPGRVPTSWTRPLQYAVAAVFALWGIYSATIPFWMSGVMDGYMRQVALQQAQQAPELYPNPNQYADMMSSIATASLAVGVIIAAAIAVVVVIGAFKRWTWLFYVVLVLLALQVAGLPFQLASAFGAVSTVGPRITLPPFVTWTSVVGGVIAIALGGWMLVALITRGPWAMRRPSGSQ